MDIDLASNDELFAESRRLRDEVLQLAEQLKHNPLRFSLTNGITMNVEITKSDLKTIVSKNTQDNHFNVIKNSLAKDIPWFLAHSQYEGWRPVVPGKHPETAFFAYFSHVQNVKLYLCVRKIKNTGVFKPYAIIDEYAFSATEELLQKGTPL